MIRYLMTILTLLVLATLWLGGCGGNSTQASADTGKALLTIKWPARSTRLIPAAANCIVVNFTGPNGFTMSKEADRPTVGSSMTSTLEFDELPTHPLTITATAYPVVGGSGTAQARGTTTLTPQTGQTTLLSLTLNSTIDHVTMTPSSPSVTQGQTTSLTATAYDASGNVVLVQPGNIV